MSTGTRFYNFREGDRSEYLAIYLLSALGLVTQVPRQEDIGFDLICNLAENESGIMAFRHHYAVSVKSASTPRAVLAPPESKKSDPIYRDHFNWLFHLELPLFLGVVDKENQVLSLYSTLPAWFLYHKYLNDCGIIELVPRAASSANTLGVVEPKDCGADSAAGGRKRFEVDLGFPVTVLTVDELNDHKLLALKKQSLRRVIELGAQSARYAQMQTPFFWWFHKTIPTGYIAGRTEPDGINGGEAWLVGGCGTKFVEVLGSLAPGLMSAALLFKSANRPDLLAPMREVMLRLLPKGSVPDDVKKQLPEIYGNL